MFKYTKAAIDIVIEDIRRYCNIFKYSSMVVTILYFIYALCSKRANFIVNIILLALFVVYALLDLFTNAKKLKSLKKIIKKSYKGLKMATKGFSLFVMIYGIYGAATNVSAISIILATLMIIMWVLQLFLEIFIEIFENKKDLIVAGWNKDIENLRKPVSTVANFIKKVKGEEICKPENENCKEIKIIENKIERLRKNKIKV